MKKFFTDTYIIWYRELLRFWRNRIRVLTGFTFPLLWLAVFGTGISSSLSLPVEGLNFIDFLFPGVISQFLIFTSMFGAISILQDREFGFLKEILVSPVSRTAIALGKVTGGATTAFLQALPILAMGPLLGVRYELSLLLPLLPAMFLLSMTLSAVGVAIIARMKSLDSGQYIFQFITFPIVMLSGAFFPLRNLPHWLAIITKLNPLSYAVDFVRRIVFLHLNIPNQAATALSPTISGQVPSLWFEAGITLGFAVVLLFLATRAFRKL